MKQSIILLYGILLLCSICACSNEPVNTDECLDKYLARVNNDKASEIIKEACNELFDANKQDDEYFKCILKDMSAAKTDEDVNIIMRRCTIDK